MEIPKGAAVARWCSGCSAEQAIDVIEMEFNGQWVSIDIGMNCLTRLKDDGRIEE